MDRKEIDAKTLDWLIKHKAKVKQGFLFASILIFLSLTFLWVYDNWLLIVKEGAYTTATILVTCIVLGIVIGASIPRDNPK